MSMLSPEALNLSSRQEGGEPCAFLAEQGECRLLIPLLIRPIDPAIAPNGISCMMHQALTATHARYSP